MTVTQDDGIKQYVRLPVKVLVFDIDKDKQVREHDIIFSKDRPNSTEFLTRLMFWALNNRMAIELVHRDDHEPDND